MILNNYWNWRAYTGSNEFKQGNQSPNPNFVNIGLKSIANEDVSIAISTYITNAMLNWSLMNLSSRIGDGITDPNVDDYCLDDDKTSSFSSIARSFNISADGGKMSIVHTISGFNVTSDAITITEIGITNSFIHFDGTGGGELKETMLTRSLLEQPITVPPNHSFSITFKWVES